jgi:hypothetical protein
MNSLLATDLRIQTPPMIILTMYSSKVTKVLLMVPYHGTSSKCFIIWLQMVMKSIVMIEELTMTTEEVTVTTEEVTVTTEEVTVTTEEVTMTTEEKIEVEVATKLVNISTV